MKVNTTDVYVNRDGSLMTIYRESIEKPERWDYATHNIQTGEELTVGTVKKGDGLSGLVKARVEDLTSVKYNSDLYKVLKSKDLVPIIRS